MVTQILSRDGVILPGTATTKDDAIREVGNKLVELGAVKSGYVDAMFDRERTVSTYMGNGLAIPHGTNEAKDEILRSALAIARYDSAIDWDGQPVRFVVGIAGVEDQHLEILSALAILFSDEDDVKKLEDAKTVDDILELLGGVQA